MSTTKINPFAFIEQSGKAVKARFILICLIFAFLDSAWIVGSYILSNNLHRKGSDVYVISLALFIVDLIFAVVSIALILISMRHRSKVADMHMQFPNPPFLRTVSFLSFNAPLAIYFVLSRIRIMFDAIALLIALVSYLCVEIIETFNFVAVSVTYSVHLLILFILSMRFYSIVVRWPVAAIRSRKKYAMAASELQTNQWLDAASSAHRILQSQKPRQETVQKPESGRKKKT